jgi:mono/diheme cytochrome c family protein
MGANMNSRNFGTTLLLLLLASASALAQDGAAVFRTYCASCHEAEGNDRAPTREVLSQLSPEQIMQALEKGAMRAQAAERSRPQRRALAEYLSGKKLGADPLAPFPESAFCASTGVK